MPHQNARLFLHKKLQNFKIFLLISKPYQEIVSSQKKKPYKLNINNHQMLQMKRMYSKIYQLHNKVS